jgi:Domain of unknown function (DUF4337)
MGRMGEFSAAHALRESGDRQQQITSGEKLVPVLTAVIAVLAAIATLFAHHSSIVGLANKNEAILLQTKAADQYNYYESKRIKVQLNQALIDSGIVPSGSGRKKMDQRITKENADANTILAKAVSFETQSADVMARSKSYMNSYENYQVSATLFEVAVVITSITALMRTKVLLFVSGIVSLVGLGFGFVGLLT